MQSKCMVKSSSKKTNHLKQWQVTLSTQICHLLFYKWKHQPNRKKARGNTQYSRIETNGSPCRSRIAILILFNLFSILSYMSAPSPRLFPIYISGLTWITLEFNETSRTVYKLLLSRTITGGRPRVRCPSPPPPWRPPTQTQASPTAP